MGDSRGFGRIEFVIAQWPRFAHSSKPEWQSLNGKTVRAICVAFAQVILEPETKTSAQVRSYVSLPSSGS